MVFQPNWLKMYDHAPAYNYIVQSWDTAQKDKDYHDFSACTTWGVSAEGYYLPDILNEKLPYPQLKTRVYNYAEQWNANEVIIEDKGSGISLIQDLRYSTNLPITSFNPSKNGKVIRAATAAQYFEKGVVFLPKRHELIEDFVSQLLMFPFAENDDMVDSVTAFFLTLKDSYGDYASRPIYDDFEDDVEFIGHDRNQITGY